MMTVSPFPVSPPGPPALLVCFSHLRWNFVFQRPQHLMTRATGHFSVLFWEEEVHADIAQPALQLQTDQSGVVVATPMLPRQCAGRDAAIAMRGLLDTQLTQIGPRSILAWYYTPMALGFSEHLAPDRCVYDCMDELSAFKEPPAGLAAREDELLARADLVFTGGLSLFEAKRARHPRVHAFPSGIDTIHFGRARAGLPDPDDQADIPRPRIGFFGVIDERMDLDLVTRAAAACHEIQFVMLGPVVKIDPETCPQAPNLHWLGSKPYDELPAYLANWDAGWMPFALNAATRFISPTKTPEFLAAGLPVVSTPIVDVVREYGDAGLVQIADIDTIAASLRGVLSTPPSDWLGRVDALLKGRSWDRIWSDMLAYLDEVPVPMETPEARRLRHV